MNTDILRNKINVGAGDLIVSSPGLNLAGIGIFDLWGIMDSGLMVRDNELPAIQTIYSTDGYVGTSANVIEDNKAEWVGPAPYPGFLVQNNVAP